MSSVLSGLSNRISERLSMSYLSALLIGFVALVFLLFINNWNLSSLLASGLVLSLFAISGVVMKFLGGTGIMLTYASIAQSVFALSSDYMKGEERRATIIKGFVLVPIVVILGYAAYRLFDTLFLSQGLSLFDVLIGLYGVWSLMLMVYAIPIIRGQYIPEREESTIDEIKSKIDRTKHTLWSGYQTKIWKEYGKVYAKEFERYRDRMEEIRLKLSAVLLPFICLMLLPIPPLLFLTLVLWIRLFSLDEKPLSRGEKGVLALIVLSVLAISTWVFLLMDVTSIITLIDSAYAIGIFINVLVLAVVILRS